MKVVINTIPLLSSLTGIGKYIFYISKTLREMDKINDYTYFYGYYTKRFLTSNAIIVKIQRKFSNLIRKMPYGYKMRDLKSLIASLKKIDFDIYFEPNFIFIDRIKSKKKVVSVFDFSFDLYPEWHPEDRVLYFKENFWNSIKKADRIILPSYFIYHQAIEEYRFDKSLLKVIYLGVDHEIFRKYPSEFLNTVTEKHQLPENFILFVGSIEPRKNLKNLILAYELLPDYLRRNFSLVLTGSGGWKNREIMSLLNKNKERVIYTGYVSELELACILNKASVFVFPSFYEGFGLPPLEAMACGCPVIVSDSASLPEVCGDSAFYVNPKEPESIANSIMKIIEDTELRNQLVRKGIERAKNFRWEKTAKETLKIFEEVSD